MNIFFFYTTILLKLPLAFFMSLLSTILNICSGPKQTKTRNEKNIDNKADDGGAGRGCYCGNDVGFFFCILTDG